MSRSRTLTTESLGLAAEPVELRLPTSRGDSTESRVERQFDQLLDMLAIDQVGEPYTVKRSPIEPISGRLTPVEITTSSDETLSEESAASESQRRSINSLAPPSFDDALDPVELSVVIACGDNAASIGTCVLKAMYALEKLGVRGEVLVADGGSRDDSIEIAEALGARIVHGDEAGYGAALRSGIAAAHGKFIITADGDERYDFTALSKFYDRLCEGADVVQGCRVADGGGRVMPGALSAAEQWGNKFQTRLARALFRTPIHDVHCRMRGFRKDFAERLNQHCSGTEFAAEMLIKSSACGARISEIPITYYKPEHAMLLKSLPLGREILRTLRLYSMQCLRVTWLYPAAVIGTLGLIGTVATMIGLGIGIQFGVGTLLVAVAAIVIASQMVSCAITARLLAECSGMRSGEHGLRRLAKIFTYERCVCLSTSLIIGGGSVIVYLAAQWAWSGFATVNYSQTLRYLIPAVGAATCGVQLLATSFLLGLVRMTRRPSDKR